MSNSEKKYIAAIDQGTTSSRCIIFDHDGEIVSVGQMEHEQIFPKAGWVEHDAAEIWNNVRKVCSDAMVAQDIDASDIAAIGITNQRETTVLWDKNTGKPVYNAIVWQDTRTDAMCKELAGDDGADKYKERTGLPLATYFAGPKAKWILDNVDGARDKAEAGDLLFGTMDSWVIWNLTGGTHGGQHITDVTNASRTLMMNLDTLEWDEDIVADMGLEMSMLPEIRSNSEKYGQVRDRGVLRRVPVAGSLGDQQAAMFGQVCFDPGEAKNTYGTGNFLLLNTGEEKVDSRNGLLTTVCYQIGDEAPVYALEGSIAVTGSLVQWLRDNLKLINSAPEVETYAKEVDDNGGVYIVPAFSGLFAPRWRSDARGVMVGLTRFASRSHICRAALESVAFQTCEVVDAMNADSDVDMSELKVDGGMVVNETLMQFQADLLDVPVIRPKISETTALGAAYAAGLAVGFWKDLGDLRSQWAEDKRWEPDMSDEERKRLTSRWSDAVERSLDWEK